MTVPDPSPTDSVAEPGRPPRRQGGFWSRAWRGGFGVWNVRPQRELSLANMAVIVLFPLVFTWVLLARGYSARARVLGFGWMATMIALGVIGIRQGATRIEAPPDAGAPQGGLAGQQTAAPVKFEDVCQWRDRAAAAGPALYCRDAHGRMAPAPTPPGFTKDTPARARTGNTAAMVAMGQLYMAGPERLRNGPQARFWFRRAADLGDGVGMLDLGLLNGQGAGVDGYGTNQAEAARWYGAAAEKGVPQAMYLLAGVYRRGLVYPRDDERAVSLYRAAAAKGYAPASSELGYMYETGSGVGRDPGMALSLYQAGLARNDPNAMYYMGERYGRGEGVPHSDAKAVSLFRAAADRDVPQAQIALGVLYHTGRGVRADDVQAARLFRQAADRGQAVAMYDLGLMYRSGEGVPRDEAQATHWLEAAADAGFKPPGEALRKRRRAGG